MTIENTEIPVRGQNADGSYKFLPYDSKAPVTEKGFRTAKLTYKSTAKNPAKMPNACVLVQPITSPDITGHITALIPHITTMCENAQDAILRAQYESNAGSVNKDTINLDAIIAYLDAEATGNRMTKDSILEWFDAEMKDTLTVLIADKMNITDEPTDKQTDDINRIIAVYRGKYGALSSGATIYQPTDVERLVSAIEKTEVSESLYGSRLLSRLNGMNKKEEELLLSL